eukprot:TRINITY_DN266_c0_g1_i1.p1 TRINITY_DN266_c0_g1~~TRINITY_DN266_c0_g1_i1.p1  ORF type:complete len:913 (-),score=138.83 TRINITY_DN266_c0_g1_i1:108-2789(-)
MAPSDVEILKEAGRARLKRLKKRYARKNEEFKRLNEKLESASKKKARKRIRDELSGIESSKKRLKVEQSHLLKALKAQVVAKVTSFQALSQSVPVKLALSGHPATKGTTESASLSTQAHSTAPSDVRVWAEFENEVEAFKLQKKRVDTFNAGVVLPLDQDKRMIARSEAAVTAFQGTCAFQVVNEILRLEGQNYHLEIQPPNLDKVKATFTKLISQSRSQDASIEFLGEFRRSGPLPEVEEEIGWKTPPPLQAEGVNFEMGSAAREVGTGAEGLLRRSGRQMRVVTVDVGQELARAVQEGNVIADAALVKDHGLQESMRVEFKAPRILTVRTGGLEREVVSSLPAVWHRQLAGLTPADFGRIVDVLCQCWGQMVHGRHMAQALCTGDVLWAMKRTKEEPNVLLISKPIHKTYLWHLYYLCTEVALVEGKRQRGPSNFSFALKPDWPEEGDDEDEDQVGGQGKKGKRRRPGQGKKVEREMPNHGEGIKGGLGRGKDLKKQSIAGRAAARASESPSQLQTGSAKAAKEGSKVPGSAGTTALSEQLGGSRGEGGGPAAKEGQEGGLSRSQKKGEGRQRGGLAPPVNLESAMKRPVLGNDRKGENLGIKRAGATGLGSAAVEGERPSVKDAHAGSQRPSSDVKRIEMRKKNAPADIATVQPVHLGGVGNTEERPAEGLEQGDHRGPGRKRSAAVALIGEGGAHEGPRSTGGKTTKYGGEADRHNDKRRTSEAKGGAPAVGSARGSPPPYQDRIGKDQGKASAGSRGTGACDNEQSEGLGSRRSEGGGSAATGPRSTEEAPQKGGPAPPVDPERAAKRPRLGNVSERKGENLGTKRAGASGLGSAAVEGERPSVKGAHAGSASFAVPAARAPRADDAGKVTIAGSGVSQGGRRRAGDS